MSALVMRKGNEVLAQEAKGPKVNVIKEAESMIPVYAHVLNRGGKGIRSPADELGVSPDHPRP